ncbi:MAG: hypothetical protein A2Y17_10660 [Clostridiales bacterium GWF2_38_85]|nr:MAG: hypothetical protein A2Y17_10660 [Clostridiales bacterium GWF2_38_85]HBL83490.1 hypothetical protein [Clostridiales bacterium]
MIATMKKVTIAGLLAEQKVVLSILQDMGSVQFYETEKIDFTAQEKNAASKKLVELLDTNSLREKIRSNIEFLEQYQIKTRNLFASLDVISREVPKIVADELLLDKNKLQDAMKIVEGYKKRISEISARKEQIKQKSLELEPFLNLELDLSDVDSTKSTEATAGFIQTTDEAVFIKKLGDTDGIAYIPDDKINGQSYFILISHKDVLNELETITKQYGFIKVDFQGYKGTAAKNLEMLMSEKDALEEEEDAVASEIEKSNMLLYMENMYDLYGIEADKLDAANISYDSNFCFVMTGWIPECECELLDEKLRAITETIAIGFEKVRPEDEPPSLVENSRVVAPFEIITNSYSPSSYRDIDPNRMVAFFYTLFFGIMIGDAGYGLLIAGVCGFILFVLHPKESTRKFLSLFFMGGLSSIVMGILFGSYFGAEWFKPLLFSPLEQSLLMMIISMALGVIQMFAGYIALARKNIKSGDIIAAIFDQGFWMLFIVGLIMSGVSMAMTGEIGIILGNIGKYLTIITAIGLLLTQGRKNKRILGKLGGGLGSLYGITGFLGDVLSYTRIFALCLASGAIALVFNIMAMLFVDIPVVGYLLVIVILIIGHSINLGLSLLSTYIHTNRLQYVEFFGKFYTGDGESFKPLSNKTMYINIVK